MSVSVSLIVLTKVSVIVLSKLFVVVIVSNTVAVDTVVIVLVVVFELEPLTPIPIAKPRINTEITRTIVLEFNIVLPLARV